MNVKEAGLQVFVNAKLVAVDTLLIHQDLPVYPFGMLMKMMPKPLLGIWYRPFSSDNTTCTWSDTATDLIPGSLVSFRPFLLRSSNT